MSSTASSLLGFAEVGSRRMSRQRLRSSSHSSRAAAVSPKCTGVMFGGLQPVAHDPGLDPPHGACFNCWIRGHRRLQCPSEQVSALCYNCGRRGVTLEDCPRCSVRHREHLDKVRSQQRQEVSLGKLLDAAEHLNIECAGNSRSSTSGRRERQRSKFRSKATQRSASETQKGGREKGASAFAKRARVVSTSKTYYFHLGRETPDNKHARYSSTETLLATDDGNVSCSGETKPRKRDNSPYGKRDDSSDRKLDPDDDDMDVNNNNQNGSTTDNQNFQNSRWFNDKMDREKSDGTADSIDSRGERDCSRAECTGRSADKAQAETACNASARDKWSAREERGSRQPHFASDSVNDVRKFLLLMHKIKCLSVAAQVAVVLQVVAERELLADKQQAFAAFDDPVKDYTDLVDAIAHLPMDTQNAVLFGIATERKCVASYVGAARN